MKFFLFLFRSFSILSFSFFLSLSPSFSFISHYYGFISLFLFYLSPPFLSLLLLLLTLLRSFFFSLSLFFSLSSSFFLSLSAFPILCVCSTTFWPRLLFAEVVQNFVRRKEKLKIRQIRFFQRLDFFSWKVDYCFLVARAEHFSTFGRIQRNPGPLVKVFDQGFVFLEKISGIAVCSFGIRLFITE